MKPLKTNLYLKTALIIIIGLLLLIPTGMIESMIYERESTQLDAINEVSSKWGGEQTITGPVISIPFHRYVKQFSARDSTEKIVLVKEFMHFLPTELTINGNISPEQRNRGIYEIVVYNSQLTITGTFNKIRFDNIDVPTKNIQFDQAVLTLGISDLRGIERQVQLDWNEDTISFNPGAVTDDVMSSGINAPVAIAGGDSSAYSFSLTLDLKGSQRLYFVPVGEVTDVTMVSTWGNPSFNGSFLPDSRTVSDTGFVANWNILHLNRNYPQSGIGRLGDISSSEFGIDLLLPVDNYQKSTRSIKYAILFIVFTFLVFFFVEILNRIFIHPIQYVLVGIALIVFYTLLLSISEHLSFNLAFIVSALATLLLIVGYVKAILRSALVAWLIGGILLILYTFIFVIIQLQDYSLLIGSIGIFIILALVMYYSRKIDWYNLNMEDPLQDTPSDTASTPQD